VILAVTMTEVKYVAAAYLVVFLFVLAYLLIHATKLARLEREVAELTERIARRPTVEEELPGRVEARLDG
jgi:CcmD family protein